MECDDPPPFSSWLTARAQRVGLGSITDVCDASGIAVPTLHAIVAAGSLAGTDRSTRAWLARALKVPLREMEAFAAGRAPCIPDARVVDLDRRGGSKSSDPPTGAPAPVRAPAGRGVPVVGSVDENGDVDWLSAPSSSERTIRLPIRYPGMPDLFALQTAHALRDLCPRGACLIFLDTVPSQLQHGQIALCTLADGTDTGRTRLGRLTALPNGTAGLIPPAPLGTAPIRISTETLVRAARLIACHQDHSMI